MMQTVSITLTASNLDEVPKTNVTDLYEFKFLSRPSEMAMAELKALFGMLDINPAKLNNFSLTMEQIDSLAGDIAAIRKVSEYLTFKTGCTAIVSYMTSIETVELGDAFTRELDEAKEAFRTIRDSICDGEVCRGISRSRICATGCCTNSMGTKYCSYGQDIRSKGTGMVYQEIC